MSDPTTPVAAATAAPALGGMKIESNAAPVEQKSTETVVTETHTPVAEPAEASVDASAEPALPSADKPVDPKDNELAKERIREKLRADEAERKLKELQPKESVPEKEPNINDYKTLEEYQADYKKWAIAEGRKQQRAEYEASTEQQKQEKTRVEVATREQESRAKHADYDAIINPIVPVIGSVPLLKNFVSSHPMGIEVMYELGKNPAVLDQIMRSASVWEAGERLLGIAARLSQPKAATITNAPEPIKPIGSRESTTVKLAELASKDPGAYIAKMNKAELAKRRAH